MAWRFRFIRKDTGLGTPDLTPYWQLLLSSLASQPQAVSPRSSGCFLFLLPVPSAIPCPSRDGYGWRVEGSLSLNSRATPTRVRLKFVRPETQQENLQGHLAPGLGNCAPPIQEAKPDHLSLPLPPCAPLPTPCPPPVHPLVFRHFPNLHPCALRVTTQ